MTSSFEHEHFLFRIKQQGSPVVYEYKLPNNTLLKVFSYKVKHYASQDIFHYNADDDWRINRIKILDPIDESELELDDLTMFEKYGSMLPLLTFSVKEPGIIFVTY